MPKIARLFLSLAGLLGAVALFLPAGRAEASGEAPFGPGSVITDTADGIHAVYTADVDGDGDTDILSANAHDNEIAWYENDGGVGGTAVFTSHVITTGASYAVSVYAADVDSDGDLDVLSASSNDDKIAWYENDGGVGGTAVFTSHVITTGASSAQSVYAADVDGDGDIDVLSASFDDDKIAWYENDGGVGGTPVFTDHVIVTTANAARSVYAADVDGDGDLDVLSASEYDDKVAWYENDGGSPPSFTSRTITTGADEARSVYAADVDGDGDLDVLSASWQDDTVAWYENDGSSPPLFTTRVITTGANGARSVYAADVDSDGDVDVLAAPYLDDGLYWYENDGSSSPTFVSHVVTTPVAFPISVHAADVDDDGDMDVLSAFFSAKDIVWYPNETIHRSATFPVQSHHVITDGANHAQSVYAADLDNDGDLDVLFASIYDDKIAWYENDGSLSPASPYHIIATTANDGAHSVYAADLDNDGDLDVLSVALDDRQCAWHENNGASPPDFSTHVIASTAEWPNLPYAADVDSDGDLDVFYGDQDKVAWHENDGGSPPSFTSHAIAVNGAKSPYVADLDGDGDLDVLSASADDDEIAWHENDGGSPPAFTDHIITNTADHAVSVYAADMDNDGDLDALSASINDNKIAWYENDGSSSPAFASHVITTGATGARSIYAADLDSDGDMDILYASRTDHIAWYENGGGSPPVFRSHVVTTTGAHSVYAADVDRDGDLDALSAAQYSWRVTWYENRGGQFALATADTAPATIDSGQQDDMLRVVAAHRGHSGDTDAELSTLELLFEESAGDPLTSAEANNLIESLTIYRDDGSGSFEQGTDTLVTTVGTLSLMTGTQTVVFADSDPNVQLAYGTPVTYFVVAELTADAASQSPNQFRVTHVTESSSTAEDRDYDLPLALEFVPNAPSSIVGAAAGSCTVRLNDESTDYPSVQAAVDAAQEGDVVKVAGTCAGVEVRGGITQTVYISKSITVRGGYTTTNWTVSDPDANPTTLDAQGDGRVVYLTGGGSVTLENLRLINGNVTGNGGGIYNDDVALILSNTVVYSNSATWGGGLYISVGTATLSGGHINSNSADYGGGVCVSQSSAIFTQTGTGTTGYNTASVVGGGVYIQHGSATLNGGQIVNNSAWGGGGVYVDWGQATLGGGEIISNSADHGGGVYVWNRSAVFTQTGVSTITHNTATDGGGVYVYSGTATLSGGQILNNSAGADGGGVSVHYGHATLSGGQIISNFASWDGGGMYVSQSGATFTQTSASTITHNTATNGGGVSVHYGHAMLSGGRIVSNSADTGGGVFVGAGSATLSGGEIIRNSASDNGGGVFIEGGSATLSGGQIISNSADYGGGVCVWNSNSVFTQTGASSIAYNTAITHGGGVYVDYGQVALNGGEIISNFAGDNGGGVHVYSGQVTVSGGEIIRNSATYDGGGLFISLGGATLSEGRVFSNTAYGNGGGMYVESGIATLSGGQIGSNSAWNGGGVYVWEGSATLSGGRIVSNSAGYEGGGVYVGQSTAAFTQTGVSTITHNSADYGGGVYIGNGSATLSGGQISSNSAITDGGGVYVWNGTATLSGGQISNNSASFGGGVYVASGDGVFTQRSDSAIAYNTANGKGGGVYIGNGSATLSGGQIISNTASGDGGGMYIWTGGVVLSGADVFDNYAIKEGGGMHVEYGSATLSGGQVISNSANSNGGGIHLGPNASATLDNSVIADNQAGTAGSGIHLVGGTARLRHTTLARNHGGDGSGLYVTDYLTTSSSVALTNTILADHTVGISVTGGNTVTVNGVLWSGTPVTVSQEATATVSVLNQHAGDPAFAADGYHLTLGSAAIDKGVDAGVTVDIDGQPRPMGVAPDLGADEIARPVVVTTTTDSGPGSLRQALLNGIPGDVITFDTAVFPRTSPMTITLLSTLPEITQGYLTVDGSNAGVVLDGQYLSSGDGLYITSDGNTIKGLQIIRFPEDGVEITGGAKNNTIGGDWAVGSAPHGEGNIITLNGNDGVHISGSGTMSNTVSGNLIGLDVDGTRDIRVQSMAISPDYGGDQTLFVGTKFDGVWRTTNGGDTWTAMNGGLTISDVRALAISPNYAADGTLFAGTVDGGIFKTTNRGNSWTQVDDDVTDADIRALAISPDYASDGHVFAAARGDGVFASTDGGSTWAARNSGLIDTWFTSLAISPNYGVDHTLFATAWNDIYMSVNQGYNWTVASSGVVTRVNVLAISPNYANDQTLFVGTNQCNTSRAFWKSTDGGSNWTATGWETDWCDIPTLAISPNYAADQTLFVGGYWNGIFKSSDGGTSWTQVYFGDFNWTLSISPAYAQDQTLFVGQEGGRQILRSVDGGGAWTEVNAGLTELGNYGAGVRVLDGAQGNVIGGDSPGERNVISHNGYGQGVSIVDSGTTNNTVSGNYIGTDASGTTALGNANGVNIGIGAQYNRVGGTTPAERNVISGNRHHGVFLWSSGTMSNTISGNYIGTDASGTAALPNGVNGVEIGAVASHNLIGGDTLGERNLISGNAANGVSVRDSGTSHNTVSGNYIGTDISGTAVISNTENGVHISEGASLNLIGGSNATPGGACGGECNLISGNSSGVGIAYPGSDGNDVRGNYIGTDVSGSADLGNTSEGVNIFGGAQNNTITDNTISGNNRYGVYLEDNGTMSNTVIGNYIGTDVSGTGALGNDIGGIIVCCGASRNEVGGEAAVERNIIAFNGTDGVRVEGSDTLRNTITHNSIHDNDGMGIDLDEGGNAELSPPALTDVTANTVSGLAPVAYATVEIFSDDEDEGRVYEGSTTADAGGLFGFSKPEGFTGPNLTATATDAGGNTSEFSTPIQVACLGLTGVSVSGPGSGYTGTLYGFTAAITPVNATAPITYTWSPEPASGQGAAGASYQWATLGVHTITLVAENCQPPFVVAVSDTHTITISAPPPGCPRPLSDVSISGPTEGYTGTLYGFSSVITPVDATEPLTYTWAPPPISGQGTESVTYTWDIPGVHTVTLTVENCQPPLAVAVSDTHAITISGARPPGDDYEPDDTCQQAQPIPVDGTNQFHTFHIPDDRDWVTFDAISGTTYIIEARTPSDSLADVTLQLYDACDTFPTGRQDYDFTPDVRLQFPVYQDGPLYLRLNDYDPNAAGPNVSYHLSVRALEATATPGAVVLVAGRIRLQDPVQDNIYHVTNETFRLFRAHGYDGDRIFYLANDSQDADDDTFNDVDAQATRDDLEAAITQWAVDKVGPDRAFTIYLMDHGGEGVFYLNGPGNTVTPQDLDAWLGTLEATVAEGLRVNVIIEACHSGSFLNTLSQSGRVVMVSTGRHAVAYATNEGAVFSDAFLSTLELNASLYGAFEEARWVAQEVHPDQTPWLDDNGDGIYNSGDGLEAQRRGFAYAGTFPDEKWPPYIAWAEVGGIQEPSGVITADVRDDVGIFQVWAVIYKPSYELPDPDVTEEIVQETLPTVQLLDQDNDGVYTAVYEGFNETGEYRIVIYAVDQENLEGRPRTQTVWVGYADLAYLPLVLRGQ